jgi:endopolyphosphatase
VTNAYVKLWKHLIPEEQYHTFVQGAYFSVEVLPGSLVVVSLNTLYFYDSNKVVDGCPADNPDDPGSRELAWLEVQLGRWRSEAKQVWMTGHVPPRPGSWYQGCYRRYGELALRFQDTILGCVLVVQ